jgi:glycosyltransferase involved in cell wall biosynthesis
MHIALITYALQVGGIETFLKLLAQFFRASGHDVIFIETLTKGRWSQSFADEGFKVMRLLPSPFHSSVHHAKLIAKALKDYDLLFLNDSPSAQSILGLLPNNTVAVSVLHSCLTSMIRNATANSENLHALVAVSPAVQNSAVHFGMEEKKVVCIPNGVEVSYEWPKKTHDFKKAKSLSVVYIGAINHTQKGVLYLPGIFKKVFGEGIDINLNIVGDGPDKEQLSNSFKRDYEGKNIIVHGALPNYDAKEILRRSDVLIMPSHFEGLPIVLLEAMSSGVIPVVSRLAGCTDFVIKNRVNGFLVEVGDEIGFARALIGLANDRMLLKSLSLAAWQAALDRFSYIQTGAAYIDLAEKCLKLRLKGETGSRSGKIDKAILGDFSHLPIILVRPIRKLLRTLRLFPQPKREQLLLKSTDDEA